MRESRSLRFLFEADRLFRHACTAQNQGDFHSAYRKFSSALNLYRGARHHNFELETFLKLGDVLRQIESFKAARKAYRSAFLLTTTIRPSKNFAQKRLDALMGEALCLRAEGNFPHALKKFNRCLVNYQVNNDFEGEAYVLWAIGTTERFAGKFTEAVVHLKKSHALYSKLRDTAGTAYALCGLGGTYRMMGHANESLVCYRRANRVFKKLGDRFGLAYSFCGQSNALRMQNKITQALPYMKHAERIYRRLKLKSSLGFVFWSQSQAYCFLNRWKDAEQALQKSTRLFQSANDRRGLLYAKLGQAEILFSKNKLIYRRVFRNVSLQAKKLGLPFEQAHALRVSAPKQASKIYRRCGVSPSFFLYRTLP